MSIEGKYNCPFCGKETTFSLPSSGQTAIAIMKGAALMVVNPRAYLNTFIERKGKIGQCNSCGEVVLQCPYCNTINQREYVPAPCSKCRKKFSHP